MSVGNKTFNWIALASGSLGAGLNIVGGLFPHWIGWTLIALSPILFVLGFFRKTIGMSIIIGHQGRYEKLTRYVNNVTRTMQVCLKNTGSIELTNCELHYKVFNSKTDKEEKVLLEKIHSINPKTELFFGVASYGEPLSADTKGHDTIQLHAPPSGTFWIPPRLSTSGGAITIVATSDETGPQEVICRLWVKDGKFRWEKA